MYIIEITNLAGEEVWYEGPGWYYTNEAFSFVGPHATELEAIEAYAWHVNAIFDRITKYHEAISSPNLIVPDKRLIQ